ncbi:MAG: hypothetical protein ABIT36_09935, partial [Steroidobacteraceae bacterium]
MSGLAERVGAEHASVSAQLPTQVVSSVRRAAALQRFVALGLPHIRDDQWRYANLRPVERATFVSANGTAAHDPLNLALPAALPGIPRLIFVNGHYAAAMSSPEALPPGARILPLASAGGEHTGEIVTAEFSADERFAWLNEAFAEDGVLLQISGHASIELLFLTHSVSPTTAPPAASYPRLQVLLRPGAQLCLIERHLGGAGPHGLIDATTQLKLESGARCTHYRLQGCEHDALFLDS